MREFLAHLLDDESAIKLMIGVALITAGLCSPSSRFFAIRADHWFFALELSSSIARRPEFGFISLKG